MGISPTSGIADVDGIAGSLTGIMQGTGIYDSGSSGPVWTPASLPNIVDFGVYSDLSRLFQSSDGTVAVTAADDPVGYWMGQLDTLALIQANAGNKPKYAADGVYFLGGGTQRILSAALSKNSNDPWTFALSNTNSNAGTTRGISFTHDRTSPTNTRSGVYTDGNNAMAIVRATTTTIGSDATADLQRKIAAYDGASTAAGWYNGSKTAATVGSNSQATAHVTLYGGTSSDTKAHGWAFVAGSISDEDAALLDAWMLAGCPV